MGSGMIQNMKFRDVWAFVGQKGIKGFTENEQVIGLPCMLIMLIVAR